MSPSPLGPASIDPGSAPGGLVVHVYDRAGSLLLRRVLVPTMRPDHGIERAAVADADAVLAVASGPDVCLVVYDGDTGTRARLEVNRDT